MTRIRDPCRRPFDTINTVSYCCSVYQADDLARRRAALPTDLLQLDPHLDAQVSEHPLLPNGFPKPC